jgi:hypothetical protein
VLLGKEGEDQLDRSFERGRNVTKNQGREKYPTSNKKEGRLN